MSITGIEGAKMEHQVASMFDKLKGFAKSSQDFAHGMLDSLHKTSSHHNPIEILKRLQREAFSDLMKLRDRQDKVERMISFYKSSKGNPFHEGNTRIRGEVDISGVLLIIDDIDEQNKDAIERAGIKSGVSSRITFESTIREKDNLVAEFVASDGGQVDVGSPLSLSKVLYAANINDWFSVVGIPMGARCGDIEPIGSYQGRALTDYSLVGPPLLNQHNGSAIGLTVRNSNVIASLAQFISVLGRQPASTHVTHCLSTFGQIAYQLSENTKLVLLGLHQVPKSSNRHVSVGALVLPVGIFKKSRVPEIFLDASGLAIGTSSMDKNSSGSMALMLESELDESTRIGCWIEMKNSNSRNLQWAVSISDTPEDDFGWGISLGGLVQGPKSWNHFQVEAFMKFNIGKGLSVQPAVVYVMDGTTQFPALMMQSSWSL